MVMKCAYITCMSSVDWAQKNLYSLLLVYGIVFRHGKIFHRLGTLGPHKLITMIIKHKNTFIHRIYAGKSKCLLFSRI